MAQIPSKPELSAAEAYEQLKHWYVLQDQLAKLRAEERVLRDVLAGYYFPDAKEGTNKIDLGGGFTFVYLNQYERKVDEAALDSVKVTQKRKMKLEKLWDELFVYKPFLSTRQYRQLTDEQRAFVDEFLEIKPATPRLLIKAPGEQSEQPEEAAQPAQAKAPAKRAPRKAAAKRAPAKKATATRRARK